uniref:Wax synthase domain-containing protein n=1 Tax=Davidia involucrata TaxID=16924 RepID=A0A5B6YQ69_DAVIN
MEGEINNFIKVWLSVYICLCYCYVAGKFIPKGATRLITVIPVVCLFLSLPLNLHSMHLGGTSAFFIAWLANFKLLLFAFGKGPLSDPSISLPRFLFIACLPIKIQQNPSPLTTSKKGHKSPLNYATKALLFATLIRVYDYSEYIHPTVMLFLYCFHVYFCLEIILAMVAALARTLLGLELEPQFDEPYLSTSLQDFWGRRWNMMVSRILRPTVYDPTLSISNRILGRKWAPLPAIFSTFVVSGLMHELIFYYLGRVRPTWEITCFFLLHGLCLMAEVAIKKAVNGRCRLPRIISGPLTVALVMITGFWLFFPQLLRCKADVRALEEYAAVGEFLKDVGRALTFKSFNSTTAY